MNGAQDDPVLAVIGRGAAAGTAGRVACEAHERVHVAEIGRHTGIVRSFLDFRLERAIRIDQRETAGVPSEDTRRVLN